MICIFSLLWVTNKECVKFLPVICLAGWTVWGSATTITTYHHHPLHHKQTTKSGNWTHQWSHYELTKCIDISFPCSRLEALQPDWLRERERESERSKISLVRSLLEWAVSSSSRPLVALRPSYHWCDDESKWFLQNSETELWKGETREILECWWVTYIQSHLG